MESLSDYLNGRNERKLDEMRRQAYERVCAGLRYRRSWRYHAKRRLAYWWRSYRNGL